MSFLDDLVSDLDTAVQAGTSDYEQIVNAQRIANGDNSTYLPQTVSTEGWVTLAIIAVIIVAVLYLVFKK